MYRIIGFISPRSIGGFNVAVYRHTHEGIVKCVKIRMIDNRPCPQTPPMLFDNEAELEAYKKGFAVSDRRLMLSMFIDAMSGK